jgi:hypothetical protein
MVGPAAHHLPDNPVNPGRTCDNGAMKQQTEPIKTSAGADGIDARPVGTPAKKPD